MLEGCDLDYIPILASIPSLRLLVLPWVEVKAISWGRELLSRFAHHVASLGDSLAFTNDLTRCGWLDRPEKMASFDSFSYFLQVQATGYQNRFGSSLLNERERRYLLHLFDQCKNTNPSTMALTDCSQKNVFISNNGFWHYDFEATLIAPRDTFLTKVALNLVRDAHASERDGALAAARYLLSQSENKPLVLASLAFFLLRMAIYARVWGGEVVNPSAALNCLVAGGSDIEIIGKIHDD